MIKERTEFTIGEEATLTRIISDEDIKTFARISGDDNPVHVNDDYASGTMFGGRIAHGMLVASLISAILHTFRNKFLARKKIKAIRIAIDFSGNGPRSYRCMGHEGYGICLDTQHSFTYNPSKNWRMKESQMTGVQNFARKIYRTIH